MSDGKIDTDALQRLLRLIGGDTEDLRELVDEFLQTAPDLAASISEAAATGDRDALRIAAHTLKSNARDFGAIHLSELCAALEGACRADGPLDASAAAEDIAREEKAARSTLANLELDALGQDI
jgi:HPt (histidine-containing phosphotransfer) domain-containing protein